MSKTYLGHVFDDEIFNDTWQSEPDVVLTAMIDSGAVIRDKDIEAMIANSGNFYTIPFYNALDTTEADVNYDGQTDIPVSESKSSSQSGIVFGRAKGWYRRNFVAELSGDDPMGHIARNTGKYWNVSNQKRLIGICNGVFGATGNADWDKHKVNIATTGGGAAAANKLDIATARDVLVAANGDNADVYSMAIMHSVVANNLAKLGQLEFWKATDAKGIERPLKIASFNGLTVIIDDGMPTAASVAPGEMEYTTYLFGGGFIRMGDGRLEVPSEVNRDAKKNGGQDELITRIRRTYHPNGFSFKIPTTNWTESPTDAQLFNSANWELKFPAKAIAAAKVVSNG